VHNRVTHAFLGGVGDDVIGVHERNKLDGAKSHNHQENDHESKFN
jgi:hypothetical protein